MSTFKLAATPLEPPIEDDSSSSTAEPAFIAVSPAICRLLDQVNIIGRHLRIATLEGEPGSGKTTLARLLYHRYAAHHPEIRQCGFNRVDAREWLISHGDSQSPAGFTLLDRVDLLASSGQSLLLRILKDFDIRRPDRLVILASCESHLRELARNGQFLSELASRLTTVRLALPPLRERKEDIVPLAKLFLERIFTRYHLLPAVLTSGAVAQLLEHDWPGNLRELSGTLESAVIECSSGIIRAEDLAIPATRAAAPPSFGAQELLDLDAVIHNHILRVLNLNQGNKLRTARQLGISRSTLYRLLDKRFSLSA